MLGLTQNSRNLAWLAGLAIAAKKFDAAEAYLTELLAILLFRGDAEANVPVRNRKTSV